LVPVLPVRLCPLPGSLYSVLLGYKESSVAEVRQRFSTIVRRLLAGFLRAHCPCVAAAVGGGVDHVLAVPSSARPSGAPFAALGGLAGLAGSAFPSARWVPGLLMRTTAPVGHMRPDAGAFAVRCADRRAVAGSRVVLFDDVYVSGARAQSAAAALRLAGARAVVVVPVGRVLRPDRSAAHAAFLDANACRAGGAASMSGMACCRCVQTAAPTE
jgi:adenine/guanine phosphoribosyltransferase-like PRPP-binding protein